MRDSAAPHALQYLVLLLFFILTILVWCSDISLFGFVFFFFGINNLLFLNVAVVQLLSHVQLLCDPTDCSPPASSVHGFSQARILGWVAISFSRRYSWPRDQIQVSCIAGGFFAAEPPGSIHNNLRDATWEFIDGQIVWTIFLFHFGGFSVLTLC